MTASISAAVHGQVFLFDKASTPAYSSRQGAWLLIISLFLEVILRRSLYLGGAKLGLTSHIWWLGLKIIVLMMIACLLVTGVAKVRLVESGLKE